MFTLEGVCLRCSRLQYCIDVGTQYLVKVGHCLQVCTVFIIPIIIIIIAIASLLYVY